MATLTLRHLFTNSRLRTANTVVHVPWPIQLGGGGSQVRTCLCGQQIESSLLTLVRRAQEERKRACVAAGGQGVRESGERESGVVERSVELGRRMLVPLLNSMVMD